jgi:iron complex outermembrane receptor protein
MKYQRNKDSVICFRQWTRRRYAVFSSMGKTIKIGALSVAYTIIASGGTSAAAQAQPSNNAQQDTNKESEYALGSVVVLETAPAAALTGGSVMQSWSRSQIDAMPADNIQHLLEYAANIDLRQRGTGGVQADIRMRGGSEEQCLVLLNGVNFSDPRTGHHALNIPIDKESIERIEFIQLPGSFAGAVNIVTKNAAQTSAAASIENGSYRYINPKFNINYVKSNFSLSTAASYAQSAGYMHNTDFDIGNIYAQSHYRFKGGGRIAAQFGYQTKAFGANSFYSVGENEYENVKTMLWAVSFTKNTDRAGIQADIYHRRSYDNYAKYRDSLGNAAYDLNQDNYHQNDAAGGSIYFTYRSIIGKSTLGAQLRAEHIFSNRLGDPMQKPRPSFADGIDYVYEKWRTSGVAFLKHEYAWRKISIAASIAATCYDAYGAYAQFNAHAAYSILPALNAYITMQQGMRAPSFTELYYQGKGYLPNPALRPEQATTFEIGSVFNKNALKINASAFYRSGKDIIDWLMLEGNIQQSRNHIAIATTGADIGAAYSMNKYLQNLHVNYAYLTMTSPQALDERAKGRLFAYLRHKVSLGAEHGLFYHLHAAWNMSIEQRNGKYSSVLRGVADTPFSPVFLMDAMLQWKTDAYSIRIGCENLLNQKYYDYNAVMQAGRWMKAGVAVKF